MLSRSTLWFHFVGQIIPSEEVIFYRRAQRLLQEGLDVSGMDMAQAAREPTVSIKYIGQPTADKARGWMDGWKSNT